MKVINKHQFDCDAGTQNIDPRIPYLKKLVTQYTKLYIIIKNSRVF